LLIPPLNPPYADYATAKAVVDDPLMVANCMVFNQGSFLDMLTFDALFDGTTLTVDGTWSTNVFGFSIFFSFSAKAGATISFASTAGDVADWAIYKCDGTAIDGARDAAMPITSAPLPEDGEYFATFGPKDSSVITGFTAATLTMTSSDVWTINPVIALWDDSGTTRSLWACPKLILPPLAEFSGTWFASCAAAATALTDPKITSNCVGYVPDGPYVRTTSFTAIDGGSSLSFAAVYSLPQGDTGTWWGGVNAVAGATLSLAFTGATDVFFRVYDDTGVEIDFVSTASSPAVSIALPYTGRYTIAAFLYSATPFSTPAAVLTSPIQATYDVGLDCPARLNCGDSCPP